MPSPLITRLATSLMQGRAARHAAAAPAVMEVIGNDTPDGQQARLGDDWAMQQWDRLSAAQQEKVLADHEADLAEIKKEEPRKIKKRSNRTKSKLPDEVIALSEDKEKNDSSLEKMMKAVGDFFKNHGAVAFFSFVGGIVAGNVLSGRDDAPEVAAQNPVAVDAFAGRAFRLGDVEAPRAQPAIAAIVEANPALVAEIARGEWQPSSAPLARSISPERISPDPVRSQSAPPSLER